MLVEKTHTRKICFWKPNIFIALYYSFFRYVGLYSGASIERCEYSRTVTVDYMKGIVPEKCQLSGINR